MKTTTGTITGTGSSNALVHSTDQQGPDSQAVVTVGGTFTSCPIVVEKQMSGGTLWLPLGMTNEKTGARSSGTDTPANSTTTSYRVDVGGAKSLRVYPSSGTPTDLTVEITSGTTSEFGGTTAVSTTAAGGVSSFTFADNSSLVFGTGSDVTFLWDGTDLLVSQAAPDSIVKWGVSGAGINHVFYGDTATRDMTWDQTNNTLLFNDSASTSYGTGADIAISWDGTRLNVTQAATNSEIRWGVDGAGIDQRFYGDTASTNMLWDQSADTLVLNGVAKIAYQSIAAATGTAIPVTHSGSFPITQNGAETNTLADPTYLGQWLNIFVDTDTSGARVITAASRINQAGNTIITMTEVGDFIKLQAITIAGALKWQVVANDGAALS